MDASLDVVTIPHPHTSKSFSQITFVRIICYLGFSSFYFRKNIPEISLYFGMFFRPCCSIVSFLYLHLETKWNHYGTDITDLTRYYENNSDEEGECEEHAICELLEPYGLYIDDDQTVYIADSGRDRIVSCNYDNRVISVIAGGHGKGDRNDQLDCPVSVILDKENDGFIVSDHGNSRVMRWYKGKSGNGHILISDIDCWGLAMNNDGDIYVSDSNQHQLRRWRIGDDYGTIVAGGNGQGDKLNQLNFPTYIFVDEDSSLYVSDSGNHRVMRWLPGATEGTVVAGGNDCGSKLTQLCEPQGVSVNQLGQVYVADSGNNRVVCWYNGITQGIVVGGYGEGEESDQLSDPHDLSFDHQGNLYVTDTNNSRIQKFEIETDGKVRLAKRK